MTTVVNTPPTPEASGNNSLLIGLILLILVVLLMWIFGLPYLRNANQAPSNNGTDINIPDRIDVNIQRDQEGQ